MYVFDFVFEMEERIYEHLEPLWQRRIYAFYTKLLEEEEDDVQ